MVGVTPVIFTVGVGVGVTFSERIFSEGKKRPKRFLNAPAMRLLERITTIRKITPKNSNIIRLDDIKKFLT